MTSSPCQEDAQASQTIFWVPGQVPGRLGGTRIHISASDKMLSDQDQDKILDLICYILEISLRDLAMYFSYGYVTMHLLSSLSIKNKIAVKDFLRNIR